MQQKLVVDQPSGFEAGEITPLAFDFQQAIIRWALARGRAAVFMDTGTGKTAVQVIWADHVCRHTGGNVLILAPLCVSLQTVSEAKKFGVEVNYCRDQSKVIPGITITNYEMLYHFDPSKFDGIVLDESSILKSYMGKTKQLIIDRFREVKYKLACTATPAPNDFLELGNHSEFLNVMPSSEMIMRFFINDTMSAGSYRLKNHAKEDFWKWISTWAVCMSNPSDMGFDGSKFQLPELKENIHIANVDDLPPAEGELFRTVEISATSIHKEGRITASRRAEKIAELVNGSNEPWIIWCNTNYEADELKSAIPEAKEVRGTDSIEQKECIARWFEGKETMDERRILISKPSIFGFGLNWQHCRNVAFIGLSYSYESYYQAIRRCWRFGQKSTVNVHVIAAESEKAILQAISTKEQAHKKMKTEMVNKLCVYFGDNQKNDTSYFRSEESGGWVLHHGDCVLSIKEMVKENSIDFCIFSPPFSNLYIYSDSSFDMGNSVDDSQYYQHYKFLAAELLRAMRPGRLVAIHCKDLPLYRGRDGAMGLRAFPDETLKIMEKVRIDSDPTARFIYHSRITIWKDPVIEMQRTKNHGLLYKELCKDSCASRQGMADYIIVVRKWTDNLNEEKVPVHRGGERFFDYIGCSDSAPDIKSWGRARSEKERIRLNSIAIWQRYASPVWFDIQQTNVLNIKQAKEGNDEKHIAPLQLDVIERCIELWTNPGDVVLSPFAGIGSEGYVAVKMGRRFVGVELKESYWNVACQNLKDAESAQFDLFSEVG